MEFVKKSLVTLSMALFVAAPLSAVTIEAAVRELKEEAGITATLYVPIIEEWFNEETGKTVHVFGDTHLPNDETPKQVNDIMDQAKELDAAILIEGPYVDEPKERPVSSQQKINDQLLRSLYKQATADGIDVKNVEARSCADCPIENAFMQCGLDDSTAYFQGELPIDPFLSEKLDVAFEQTTRNYVAAFEKHREKLDSSEDGPVAKQYYDEMMGTMDGSDVHQLIMNLPTEEKQPMNNENPAYTGKEQQIDSLQKKAVLKTKTSKLQNLINLLLPRISNQTGEYGLIETNIIHNIINDKEHDTIFVVAGGLHGKNLADPLTKLGFKKIKTTGTPGDYFGTALHINDHFSDAPAPINEHFDDAMNTLITTQEEFDDAMNTLMTQKKKREQKNH